MTTDQTRQSRHNDKARGIQLELKDLLGLDVLPATELKNVYEEGGSVALLLRLVQLSKHLAVEAGDFPASVFVDLNNIEFEVNKVIAREMFLADS